MPRPVPLLGDAVVLTWQVDDEVLKSRGTRDLAARVTAAAGRDAVAAFDASVTNTAGPREDEG